MNLELSLKILGAALWLALAALMQLDAESESWIVLLLMFSPLFLMPLSRRLIETPQQARRLERSSMAAAILLGLSFCWQPALSTAALALPWLLLRLLAAYEALTEKRGPMTAPRACLLAARLFPAVGAAWAFAHRAHWTPFGFDPLIILLTAAHFHHAGFTLPLIAGLNAQARPGCWTRFSCVAILIGIPLVAIGIPLVAIGIPLVAIGITGTHFGVLRFVEPFGVIVLVLGALGVALSQLRLATQPDQFISHRLLHSISGLTALAAMALALGFGLRQQLPWAALTMPQMWLIHGSLNVFGFGLCGLLGWRLMQHHRPIPLEK